jgi:hypothetical protein
VKDLLVQQGLVKILYMKTRKPKTMKHEEWEELKMAEVTDPSQHFNLFNQIISDLLRIDVKFDEEDKERMLLASLLASYEHPVCKET